MAITEDTVYSGANEKGGQPIGFYFNSVACTNAAETIVDDEMDANNDTLCTITPSINAAGIGEKFEFIIYIDGTQIMVKLQEGDSDASSYDQSVELIIPAGKNLKVTGDNQSSGTSTECSVYVLIKPLVGSLTT
mgnify:CR=1 FL=1